MFKLKRRVRYRWVKSLARSTRKLKKLPEPRIAKNFATKVESTLLKDLKESFPRVANLIRGAAEYRDLGNGSTIDRVLRTRSDLLDTAEIAAILQGRALIKKFRPVDRVESLQDAAFAAFSASEQACSEFNTQGWKLVATDTVFVDHARRFIRRVIGWTLPESHHLMRDARHGPGTSVGQCYDRSHAYYKYVDWPYTVTAGALDHARAAIEADARWLGALEDSYRTRYSVPKWRILDWDLFWSSVFKVCPGNRVTTVPKDSSKDRTIAIEPTMNVYLQLGIDGFIRRRLKRFGIDLDNQTHNSELAWIGSKDQSLATLDLSAASDSISLRICKLLLPPCWYEHLCSLRSPKGQLPGGKVLRYSKISSMGNGFTFALESLIFASVIYACLRMQRLRWNNSEVAVYGDDLIVPTVAVNTCVAYLELCGFRLNLDKSFFREGLFRESCGTDWYGGKPVRPVYLKEQPASVQDLFHLRNSLLRWCDITQQDSQGTTLRGTLEYIESVIPEACRIYGPPDDNDTNSYLASCEWVPSFDKRGNARPYKRIVRKERTFKVKDWLFGRLIATHSGGKTDTPRDRHLFLRWRGCVVLEVAPALLRCKSNAGSRYETPSRLPGRLRVAKGYRLTPGSFGRSVVEIAESALERRACSSEKGP